MRILPRSIEKLISELSRLPGIGPKSASRLTFFLYKMPEVQFNIFADAVRNLKTGVTSCRECFNMSEAELCGVCADPSRNHRLICVVEDPLDVLALEQTRSVPGVYHVLGGIISPMDGVGPEQLKIAELASRIRSLPAGDPAEVILAINPSLEGEATVAYLIRELRPLGVKLTKLARGIPVGGDLEYTDEQTLTDALNFRKEIQ